ncbi:MAG: methyltransferase domain-containing protein, partial [Myxococcota bacterium]
HVEADQVVAGLEITHRTGAEVVKGDLEPRDDLIRLDVTDIQFSEGHFDGILCNHVLEHVPDDRRAMSELYRVLAPAGWAVLAVPIDTNRAHTYEDPSITEPEDRAVHFGQSDHVRWYGRDYAGRLREAGFTVEEFRVQEAVGADAVGAYGLDPGEWVHLCRK